MTPRDDLDLARLGVMAALADGDAGLAYRLVGRLMDDGLALPALLDDVLAPIQRESGRRWASGDVSISEEHAATAAVETVVALLAGSFDQPPEAELVVLVCAEGESHSLPARMATALLAYEGYRTLYLGPAVPADDLGAYLASADADAVVVSCTRPANLLGARACVAAAHGAGLPVVVGGRAFAGGDLRWTGVGADAHAPTLGALAEVLRSWRPDPSRAEKQARPLGSPASTLLDQRVAVVERLVAELGRARGTALPVPARREAATDLVDVLAVALHFHDAGLLAEEAGWLAGLPSTPGDTSTTAEGLLAALAEATRGVLPADADVLVEARRQAR